MNRRSLTLLEVLIVAGLLLTIAAIVAPSVMRSLHEQAFETAADVTGEQLMLARAHAQATGKSVEVRYNKDHSRVEARLFMPWLNPVGAVNSLSESHSARTASSSASGQTRDDEQGDMIMEPWASRSISKSVRIASRRSMAQDDRASSKEDEALAKAIESELTVTDDVRLAVFMPDGTALLNDPFWFEDEDGRVGKLTINPFSGLPAWERLLDLAQGVVGADGPEHEAAAEPSDREGFLGTGGRRGETAQP